MVLPKQQIEELLVDFPHIAPTQIRKGKIKYLAPNFRDILERSSGGLMPSSRDRYDETFQDDFLQSRKTTFIHVEPKPREGQIGISGLDLRLGRRISWCDYVANNITEADMASMAHKDLDEGEEFVLEYNPEGDRIYYVQSFEAVNLSPDLDFLVDSKSTTGRVGCMSHGVGRTLDRKLITAIQPFAFPLKVTCGKTTLSQAIIRYKGTPYMTNEEVLSGSEVTIEGRGISLEKSLTPRGLQMSFDTKRVYRAKRCDAPIDMDAKETLKWRDYFELIEGDSQIDLAKKNLYLIGTREIIGLSAVCGILSREQGVLTGTGTWGHFAGIFQPLWKGGITMEVYSFSNRRIKKEEPAGVVIFDRVEIDKCKEQIPESSYQNQVPPLLPKMFKTD